MKRPRRDRPVPLLRIVALLFLAGLAAVPAAPARAGPSPEDLAPARAVLAALGKKQYAQARKLALDIKEPLARTALLWRLAQFDDVPFSFAELAAIYRSVETWPLAGRIANRTVDAIGGKTPGSKVPGSKVPDGKTPDGKVPDDAILAWFKDAPPSGIKGWTIYISALARSGRADQARDAARKAWTTVSFAARDEAAFHRRFGQYLGPDEDRARLLLLLRSGRTKQARALWERAILPGEDKAAMALRIAMQSKAAAAEDIATLIPRLPESIRDQPDFLFDQVRWNRRGGRDQAAGALLGKIPAGEADDRRWGGEASRIVRDLLDGGKAQDAYRTAATFAAAKGETWATMEFLAGWIALRKLARPADALAHFQSLFARSQAAITRGRGAYWAALAAQSQGDPKAAHDWLIQAAGFPQVFYGQLAIAALGHDRLVLPADIVPNEVVRGILADRDRARAAQLFAALGEDRLAHLLLLDLAMAADAPSQWAAVADFAVKDAQRREVAVRAARRASVYNVPLFALGFPTIELPGGSKIEPAFAFAIIRQESEFYLGAVSPTGALGLMQLMPATARQTAQRLKLRYDRAKLAGDETYNLKLGTAFLAHLVDRYDGSYALAAAAYNGGPGNLRKWLARYGDPRQGKVDIVDWIESIPFDETRNYVQRVLENLAIYRQRMGMKSLSATPGALWRPPKGDELDFAKEPPPLP